MTEEEFKKIMEVGDKDFLAHIALITGPKDIIQIRESTHGDWKVQSRKAQEIKGLFATQSEGFLFSTSQKEALDLIATKLSRIMTGDPNEPEHWLDIAGYATLVYNDLKGIKSKDVK